MDLPYVLESKISQNNQIVKEQQKRPVISHLAFFLRAKTYSTMLQIQGLLSNTARAHPTDAPNRSSEGSGDCREDVSASYQVFLVLCVYLCRVYVGVTYFSTTHVRKIHNDVANHHNPYAASVALHILHRRSPQN